MWLALAVWLGLHVPKGHEAVLFFVTSLGLTLLALHGRPESSILDSAPPAKTISIKPMQLPAGPQVPAVPSPH